MQADSDALVLTKGDRLIDQLVQAVVQRHLVALRSERLVRYMNGMDHTRKRPGAQLTEDLVRASTASCSRLTDRHLLREFAHSRKALEDQMRHLETKAGKRQPYLGGGGDQGSRNGRPKGSRNKRTEGRAI